MMKNSEDIALDLYNFYRDSLESCCGDCSTELAISFAMDHCDRMIAFIDSEMKGWLDTDLIAFWKSVKQNITKY